MKPIFDKRKGSFIRFCDNPDVYYQCGKFDSYRNRIIFNHRHKNKKFKKREYNNFKRGKVKYAPIIL